MIGAYLQNRYRLDAELGHGGMGTVYRTYDTLLDRPVALLLDPVPGVEWSGPKRPRGRGLGAISPPI